VAVLLARFGLGQSDTRDFGIGVDRPWDGTVVDGRLVPTRVLRGDLPFAKSRVRELPVARAIADGVDVVHSRAPMLIRGNSLPPVEVDADRLETDPFDARAAAHRDEHQVGFDGLAVSEMDGEHAAVVVDLRALLLEVERDATLAELLGELPGRVRILLRNERRQHLDDRHLATQALEDRA